MLEWLLYFRHFLSVQLVGISRTFSVKIKFSLVAHSFIFMVSSASSGRTSSSAFVPSLKGYAIEPSITRPKNKIFVSI